MAIDRFVCAKCSATLKLARPKSAGSKIRCPKCGAISVLGEDEEDRIRADRPSGRSRRATDDDEPPRLERKSRRLDDDDDAAPGRSRRAPAKSSGNKGLLWGLVIGGGGLAIAAVVVLMVVLSGGRNGGPGTDQQAKDGLPKDNLNKDNVPPPHTLMNISPKIKRVGKKMQFVIDYNVKHAHEGDLIGALCVFPTDKDNPRIIGPFPAAEIRKNPQGQWRTELFDPGPLADDKKVSISAVAAKDMEKFKKGDGTGETHTLDIPPPGTLITLSNPVIEHKFESLSGDSFQVSVDYEVEYPHDGDSIGCICILNKDTSNPFDVAAISCTMGLGKADELRKSPKGTWKSDWFNRPVGNNSTLSLLALVAKGRTVSGGGRISLAVVRGEAEEAHRLDNVPIPPRPGSSDTKVEIANLVIQRKSVGSSQLEFSFDYKLVGPKPGSDALIFKAEFVKREPDGKPLLVLLAIRRGTDIKPADTITVAIEDPLKDSTVCHLMVGDSADNYAGNLARKEFVGIKLPGDIKPKDDFTVAISNVRITPVTVGKGKACRVSVDLRATGKPPAGLAAYQCGLVFKVKGVKQNPLLLGQKLGADALLKGLSISNVQVPMPDDVDDLCDIVVFKAFGKGGGPDQTVARFTDASITGAAAAPHLIVLKNVRVDALNDRAVYLQFDYELTGKLANRQYLIKVERDEDGKMALALRQCNAWVWGIRGDQLQSSGKVRAEVGQQTGKFGLGKVYRVWAISEPSERPESATWVVPINGVGVEELKPGDDTFRIAISNVRLERLADKGRPAQCAMNFDLRATGKATDRAYQCAVAFRIKGVKQQSVTFGDRFDAQALLKGVKVEGVKAPLPDGADDDCEIVVQDAKDNSAVTQLAVAMAATGGYRFVDKKIDPGFTMQLGEPARTLALSPKEDKLACLHGYTQQKLRQILLIDPKSGKQLDLIANNEVPVEGTIVDFTPDGNNLIIRGNGTYSYDFASKKKTFPYGEILGDVKKMETVLAVFPRGGFFIKLREKKYAVLDDKTFQPTATLQDMPTDFLYFYASPDTKRLAAWGFAAVEGGHKIYTWDRETGKRFPEWRFPGNSRDPLRAPVMSHDNESIAAFIQGARGFHVADLKTGKRIYGGLGHARPMSALAFSPDNKLLVTAGEDDQICVWDARDGFPLVRFSLPPKSQPESLLFSSDSQRLYVGCTVAGGELIFKQGAVHMFELPKVLEGIKLEEKKRVQPKGTAETTGRKDKSVQLLLIGEEPAVRAKLGMPAHELFE